MNTPHRIVVLGAGYAGLAAAKRLARLLGGAARVILVNRSDRFVERIRLHQLAAGQDLHDLPLPDLLAGTGVELVVATVTGLDLGSRTVVLDAIPYTVDYDTLVYALGSGADVESVPGVREHALTVAELDATIRTRDRVADLRRGAGVTVVGAGLTGIETATELAQARPELRVTLVTDGPLGGWLSDRGERYLAGGLDRLGIVVHRGERVRAVTAHGVRLCGGRHLAADAVVWTAGFSVPDLAADAGLTVDHSGRMVVDRTLRSVSHPDVHGIGDAARGPGDRQARMSCQTALPMGWYVAKAVARRLDGWTPAACSVRYVWQNVSLGRRDGLTQFTHADDSPRDAVLTGRVASAFKETIARGTVQLLRRPGLGAPRGAADGSPTRRIGSDESPTRRFW